MASTSHAGKSKDSSQNLLIEQFICITGSTREKATNMLEVCNWNVEMAINMHVDTCHDNSFNNSSNGEEVTEVIRAPIPQSRAVLVEEDISLHYGLRGMKRRPHAVFDGFRDFQAEAELQERSDLPVTSESSRKRRTLEDLFRPPLDIMHRGNFESARDYGQMSNRWLLVNLQNVQEFACQVLNRDVWSNKSVKKLVAQNFVFWQVYLDSIDGQRYMQFYKPDKFPYIAVIDPRTGEKLVEWNSVDSSSIIELINVFLHEHCAPDGSTAKTTTVPGGNDLLDQSEEEQLKAALEASLKDVKPSPIVIDDDSDLETFDSDSENTNDKETILNVTDNSSDTIDVVGLSSSNNHSSTSAETHKDFLGSEDDPKSNLVLRLPDGKKEQISWPCTTKLKALILYTGEIGYDPEKYELVTNYPRRNLCQLDMSKSLKEVDLFPREMVFVQLKT